MMNRTTTGRPSTASTVPSKTSTLKSPKPSVPSSNITNPITSTNNILSGILASGKTVPLPSSSSSSSASSSSSSPIYRPSTASSSLSHPTKSSTHSVNTRTSLSGTNSGNTSANTNNTKGRNLPSSFSSSSFSSSLSSPSKSGSNKNNITTGSTLLSSLYPSSSATLPDESVHPTQPERYEDILNSSSSSSSSFAPFSSASSSSSSASIPLDGTTTVNDSSTPSDIDPSNPFASPSLLNAAASMANLLAYDPVSAVLSPSTAASLKKVSSPSSRGTLSTKPSSTPVPPLSPTDSLLHMLSSSSTLPNAQTLKLLEETLQKTKEENDILRHELIIEKKVAGATSNNYDQQIRLLQQEMETLRNDSLSTVNKVSHMHEHSELVHLQEQIKAERLATHATKRTLTQKTHEFEAQIHDLKKQFEHDLHLQQEETKKARHALANEKQARTDAANLHKEEKHRLTKEIDGLRKQSTDKESRITQLQIAMATLEEKRKNEYNLHESKLADMYRRFTAKETECNEKIQLILNLNENILDLRKEIEDTKGQHQQALATVQQEKEKLKVQHTEELNNLRKQMDSLKQIHQEEVTKLHEQHSANVLSIADKHAQVSSQLQDEHHKFKLQAKETEDQLLTKFTKEMEDLVHLHEQSLHQTKQHHENTLQSLKTDLETIIDTLEKEKKELVQKMNDLENAWGKEKDTVKEGLDRETQLQGKLKEAEEKFNQLALANQETFRIQNDLKDAQLYMQQLEDTVKELRPLEELSKNQINVMEERTKEWTDQLTKKDEEIRSLRNANETLQQEYTKMVNDNRTEMVTVKKALALAEATAQGKMTEINAMIDSIRNESREMIVKLTQEATEANETKEKLQREIENDKDSMRKDHQKQMDALSATEERKRETLTSDWEYKYRRTVREADDKYENTVREWETKYTKTVDEWSTKYATLTQQLLSTESDAKTLLETKENEYTQRLRTIEEDAQQRIQTTIQTATEKVRSQITYLETENHSLQMQLTHLQGDLSTKTTELEGQIQTSTELATQVDNLHGTINKLTLQNSSAQSEIENLQKQLRTSEETHHQEITNLRKQIEEVSSSLDLARGSVRDEKNKVEQANHEIHQLKEKLTALERATMEERTIVQTNHAKELAGVQATAHQEITHRDQEIAGLRETLISTTKAMESARESNHALSSELNTLKASYTELKVEFDAQVIPLQAMKESAQARATTLSEELHACESKLAVMTIAKEDLEKKGTEFVATIADKTKTITSLEESLAATQGRLEAAEDLAADNADKIKDGLARIAELEHTLEITKNQATLTENRLIQENKAAEERAENRIHQIEAEAAAKLIQIQQDNYQQTEQLRMDLTNTIEQLRSELTINMNKLKTQRQINAETEERKMFFQQQAETERRQRSIENTLHAEELAKLQEELGTEKEKRSKAEELNGTLTNEVNRLRGLLGTERKQKEKFETALKELQEQSAKEIQELETDVEEAEAKLLSLQQQLHNARTTGTHETLALPTSSPLRSSLNVTASPLPEERIRHQAEINGDDLIQACIRNDAVSVRDILHRAYVNVDGTLEGAPGEGGGGGLKYRTPLEWAVLGRHSEIVDLLLKKGAKLEERMLHPTAVSSTVGVPHSSSQELSLLAKACRLGDDTTVKLLLSAGAPVNEYQQHHHHHHHHHPSSTSTNGTVDTPSSSLSVHPPLLEAVEAGHTEVVRSMVEWGADMEVRDIHGHTSFLLASKLGHVAIVEYLLTMKCSTGTLNKANESGLFLACTFGHLEVVVLLMNQGLPLTCMNNQGRTILHTVCENGHTDILQYLIKATSTDTNGTGKALYGIIDINARDDEGFTCLMLATKNGHYDTVKLLVETAEKYSESLPLWTTENILSTSLQYETRDTNGRTALLLAAEFQRLQVFEYLLSIGSDPLVKDNFGTTLPLIICKHGNAKLLESLMTYAKEKYSKTNTVSFIEGKDSTGSTPLMEACWKGDETCVRLLLQANVSVHMTDKAQETCLGTAAYAGHVTIVQLLLNAGAQVNVRNQFNQTPLLRACERGHEEIALLLLQHGADVHYHEVGISSTEKDEIYTGKDGNTSSTAGASPSRKVVQITDYARERRMDKVLRYLVEHNL